jgi:hypothetical protein
MLSLAALSPVKLAARGTRLPEAPSRTRGFRFSSRWRIRLRWNWDRGTILVEVLDEGSRVRSVDSVVAEVRSW